MSAVAVALVLTAAAVHAGWNRFLHDITDRRATLAIASLAGSLLLLPAIITSPPTSVLGLVALSALAETAYAICLAAAYRRGALSLAYPIGRGTAPLLVTLGAWSVLGQRPSGLTIAGAAGLALGLCLVAAGHVARDRTTAIVFAVLTGVSIAAYSVIDARAVHHASPAGYLGLVLGIEGVLLTISIRAEADRLRRALRPGLLVAVGTVAAYLLVLLAFQRANAGPVATLREVSVLIGMLLARDTVTSRAWAGGVLVVAGAIMVSL